MSSVFAPIDVWADYFAALDPQERLTVFNETAAEDDPLAAFLAELYDLRYHDPSRPGQSVDTWLWKFVYLPGLYQKRRVSKKSVSYRGGAHPVRPPAGQAPRGGGAPRALLGVP